MTNEELQAQKAAEEAAKKAEEAARKEQDIAYSNLMEQFKNYKENSVPIDEYNRLADRNKKLSESYVESLDAQAHKAQEEAPKPDVQAMRAELFGNDRKEMTNLEYMDKVVKFRDAAMEAGERDPFLPTGGPEKDSLEAHNTADKVANGLKQMIKDANGSPEAFNALYQARVEDIQKQPGRRY